MAEQERQDKQERSEEKARAERREEEQIYASHGISQDLLQGINEYKNALFRGSALVVMIVSFLMIIACAAVCGIVSSITLLAEVVFSIEAMLLLMEKNAGKVIRILARVFFFLPLPMIVILFAIANYAPTSLAVQITLGFFGVLLLGTAVFGMVWYFTYYPYRERKTALRAARTEIREQRQMTDREQRRSIRQKRKAIARLKKQERREKFLEEKRQLYEFARRQTQKAQDLTQKLPGVHKNEEAEGPLRLVEGSGKGGRRRISPEEASRQASRIIEELERDGQFRAPDKEKAAGAEGTECQKK